MFLRRLMACYMQEGKKGRDKKTIYIDCVHVGADAGSLDLSGQQWSKDERVILRDIFKGENTDVTDQLCDIKKNKNNSIGYLAELLNWLCGK